jgi:hypothetical protein
MKLFGIWDIGKKPKNKKRKAKKEVASPYLCDSNFAWDFYRKKLFGEKIEGKYLFFSTDRKLLESIIDDEFKDGECWQAKISREPRDTEYVLCLYFEDRSMNAHLQFKYLGREDVKYRGWKTNEATRRESYQWMIDIDPMDFGNN